jgi:hypothetical protein
MLFEHVPVQEQEGAEGLVLGRGGHVLIDSQMGQKSLDLGSAHVGGMALVMEQDIACDPADVGLLRTDRVVLEADRITDLVEQPFGTWRILLMRFHSASWALTGEDMRRIMGSRGKTPATFRITTPCQVLYSDCVY